MRSLLLFIFFAFVFSIFLISCDVIDQPYLRDGSLPPPDTAACPVPDFPSVPAAVQNVLLEDYTGHKCPNCPEAAVLAHDLYVQWAGRLKLVAIHAGWFSTFGSSPYNTNYTTPAGDAWDQFFGISNIGNPNGMINRSGYSQSHIINPNNWTSQIQEALQESPVMMLQLINEYSPTERKLCAHVRASWLQDLQEGLNLVLFITEDSLVSPQKNNNPQVGTVPDIMEYTHMHILRHAVSGPWGNPLSSSDTLTNSGNKIIQTYRYDLPEHWKPEHCKVVAFVYRTGDFKILQVEDGAVLAP